jgi:predicted dinucleotide-binding enzyme
MKIGVIGSGHIGGNCAHQFAKGGHEVMLSGSGEPAKYEPLAAEIGDKASVGKPADAADFGEVIVFAVPWDGIDEALAAAGGLGDKIVIDTTNQYGKVSPPAEGETGAQHNAARMPGARYTKSFNTLTSAFQAETAGREGDERTVQWLCSDDAEAKGIVAGLIEDAGYAAVDVGGNADAAVMEAPRREGAVYGEAYRPPEAQAVVDAVKAGEPIPPAPSY